MWSKGKAFPGLFDKVTILVMSPPPETQTPDPPIGNEDPTSTYELGEKVKWCMMGAKWNPLINTTSSIFF